MSSFNRQSQVFHWGVVETPLGSMYVAVGASGALRKANFEREAGPFLKELASEGTPVRDDRAVREAASQIRAYFARERTAFDLPVDFEGLTPFQREVLKATASIPYGAVWTYREVADAVGRPRAARAVGGALAQNPVCVVIPCHRVVASDGGLGGYSGYGGLETKRRLLELEGAWP